MTGPLWKPTRTVRPLTPDLVGGRGLPHGALHVDGGLRRLARAREGAHHLIADGLDDGAEVAGRAARQDGKRLGDDRLSASVAERLVKLGTAADVHEQHGAWQPRALDL